MMYSMKSRKLAEKRTRPKMSEPRIAKKISRMRLALRARRAYGRMM